jgi:acyl-coenzyme A synthetase/AMP-(fatty) acid ligase
VILVPALPRTATGKVDRAAVWAAVRPASAAWESGKKS